MLGQKYSYHIRSKLAMTYGGSLFKKKKVFSYESASLALKKGMLLWNEYK